jgi:hypothetical protein
MRQPWSDVHDTALHVQQLVLGREAESSGWGRYCARSPVAPALSADGWLLRGSRQVMCTFHRCGACNNRVGPTTSLAATAQVAVRLAKHCIRAPDGHDE